MRNVMMPALLSFRLRRSLSTRVPTRNHVSMLIMNHTNGLFMNGLTMYSRAHSVCTTLHSPVKRSSISKASEPAKMTCMTSSDVLCRSLLFSWLSMSLLLPRISSCRRNICVSDTVSVMPRRPFTSCLAPAMIFCMSSMRTFRSSSRLEIFSTAKSLRPAESVGSALMLVSWSRLSRRYSRISSSRMMSLDVSLRTWRICGMLFGSFSYSLIITRTFLSVSSTMKRREKTLCTKMSRARSERKARRTGSWSLAAGPTIRIPCEPMMTKSLTERSKASYVSPSTCLISFSKASLSMYFSALCFGTTRSATMTFTLSLDSVWPRKTMSSRSRWWLLMSESWILLESMWMSTSKRARLSSEMFSRMRSITLSIISPYTMVPSRRTCIPKCSTCTTPSSSG
mmetsp:Transcript_11013/g.38237  ORF Transcript_11013/g.38237 Transcript_11013/m.38237 type:complete len:397 (+) Transcript_11013:809-1999(+)